MPDESKNLFASNKRSSWIRLRTLTMLRWFAIIGQCAALATAHYYFDLIIEIELCILVVGVSVAFNLFAMIIYPHNKRLTERQNALLIMFDLLQLCILLFLTGGLNNPFAMLVIGPVAVSASILRLQSTLVIGTTAIALITAMVFFSVPIRIEYNFILRMPEIFIFGNWAAIIIALIFVSIYSYRVANEMNAMSDGLMATQMALGREQKLTDLGGVVAAAAHELGTPLATIKLTSAELMEELEDRPDLYEDAALIREQADRCRDILRSMGRAGKDDLHLRSAPISEVIREAADPHQERGKTIEMVFESELDDLMDHPEILRKPEIIHGLRNMIQNAVDFARTTVWVEATWNKDKITLRIIDDGPGYPQHLLGRIGDPLLKRRRSNADMQARPEYEGMGLGLFIAKTLLERTGADLSFANMSLLPRYQRKKGEPNGAVVEIIWTRSDIQKSETVTGQNQQIKY